MRKFVFGPILSRRLGRSLGVDLVTHKTCPLDCIYCEAKATTNLTMERKEYVPVDEVLAELKETLDEIEAPDYVTFSGAGEPTLNSGIGKVIDFIKSVRSEWFKIVWPNRETVVHTTIMILVFSGLAALFFFIIDSYPECKVCLLTNGLLLSDEKLQQEVR